MTPAQQSALETLAGRALLPADTAALDPLLDWDTRNDQAIAAHLSIGRTAILPTLLTDIGLIGRLMESHGPQMAESILGKLKAMAGASELVEAARNKLRGTSGLDFGDASVRAQITALGQIPVGGFTVGEVAALLALAVVPDPLSTNAVSDALNVAEGRMTLGG